MRPRLVLAAVAALALAAVAVVAGSQVPKPGPTEQKIVLVPGSQAWTPTQFLLRENDKVTLTASGKVCFSAGHPQSCQGPEGWGRATYQGDWPEDANACDDPFPQFNHAMLLGRVGDDVFPVGASEVFTERTGALALGINDCSLTGDFHNTGQYSAIVKIERGSR